MNDLWLKVNRLCGSFLNYIIEQAEGERVN
jgi:hypothetical protein